MQKVRECGGNRRTDFRVQIISCCEMKTKIINVIGQETLEGQSGNTNKVFLEIWYLFTSLYFCTLQFAFYNLHKRNEKLYEL